ncbi:hypothetical protein HOLleu_28107 [Holothuria leucospilota]|uniref:IgGFc-binding protein N-terminal domain-containing protein n=1 Tax=Holothuria leucospilota TaxID=206669 RepID=A0A9Q1H1R4_HOLLE|nr:hypothetical protein HOLleu_28107 [Holothuria leucospilota]
MIFRYKEECSYILSASGNNNEPVCYLKTKLDDTNTQITKIDCAEAGNFHWSQVKRFETRSAVSMTELMVENDGIRAPSTSSQTGKHQYQDDSEISPSTAPQDTSKRETEIRYEDTEETSSNSPYLMSMAATEVNQAPSTGAETSSMMDQGDTDCTSHVVAEQRKGTFRFSGAVHYYAFTFLPIENFEKALTAAVEIYIASSSSVTVHGTIFFPFQSTANISFTLAYGQDDVWELPLTIVPRESDINSKISTTIVVETDEKVTVVGHQRCQGSYNRATAFRVRDVASLGTEYLLLAYRAIGITQAGIVALNDGTSVRINGSLQNLDKYEAFYFGGLYDVTGTNVTSNQPVSVLVGNQGDKIPSTLIGHDADYEHLEPRHYSWGQRFLVPPFPLVQTLHYEYTVRIVAKYDGTNVTLSTKDSNQTHVYVMQGNVITRFVDSRNVLEITSSKPILVAKFLTGVNTLYSMVFIPPVNSLSAKSVVIRVLESTESAFINVWLTEGNEPTAISFSGSVAGTWEFIHNDTNGNSIVQMSLTENVTTYTLHSNGNFGIAAVIYGKCHNSYYTNLLP